MKNKNINGHNNNYMGFNGIVNIRTNLINNDKNIIGFNNKKKYILKNIKENNGFSTLFNANNNFSNNIFKISNNENNLIMEDNRGKSKTLFDGNTRRIISSKFFLNQSRTKNLKQK